MAKRNLWKYAYITCMMKYYGINSRKWYQTFGLYIFNHKFWIELFSSKYLSMYVIKYLLSTSKSRDWGYTYTLIIEKHS